MQGEKWETLTKTCNETMLRTKLRVFVSRISPPFWYPASTALQQELSVPYCTLKGITPKEASVSFTMCCYKRPLRRENIFKKSFAFAYGCYTCLAGKSPPPPPFSSFLGV